MAIRKREKKLSETTHHIKIFMTDLRHIRRKLKDENDKAHFKSISSAIRHYVHNGIAAEDNIDYTRNSLKDRIVREAQKNIVFDAHKPLTRKIDRIETLIKNLEVQQDLNFRSQSNQFVNLEDALSGEFSKIAGFLNNLPAALPKAPENTSREPSLEKEILKNILVLRSVMYVYVLGMFGKAVPITGDGNHFWVNLLEVAHREAHQLSALEIFKLDEEELELKLATFAKEIYSKAINGLKRMPKLPNL